MKSVIGVWTYWLGLACALITLVMRTFNAFGLWLPERVVEGSTIWYMSFYKATLLFLLISVATSLERTRADRDESRGNRHHYDQEFGATQVERKFRTAKAGT